MSERKGFADKTSLSPLNNNSWRYKRSEKSFFWRFLPKETFGALRGASKHKGSSARRLKINMPPFLLLLAQRFLRRNKTSSSFTRQLFSSLSSAFSTPCSSPEKPSF